MTTKIGDNIGIGTTSPEGRLHIVNTQGGGTGRIIFNANVSSGYNTKIDATDTGLEFTAQSNSRGFAFNTGSTPTEKMRIQAGGGISFNGDTAAANALDDYEEGTWTPSFVNGTFTYGTQSGQFTKIGNVITVHGYITWSAKSGTGILRANLPATCAGTRVAGSVGYVKGVDITGDYRQIVFATSVNETVTTFFILGDNTSPNNMSVQNLSSDGELQFTMTYTVQ